MSDQTSPRPAKRYDGEVMVPNLSTDPESHHCGRHWRIPECDPLACRPENTEGPGGDDPVAADGVMVVQSLGAQSDGDVAGPSGE